jgi:hypothetical protein
MTAVEVINAGTWEVKVLNFIHWYSKLFKTEI